MSPGSFFSCRDLHPVLRGEWAFTTSQLAKGLTGSPKISKFPESQTVSITHVLELLWLRGIWPQDIHIEKRREKPRMSRPMARWGPRHASNPN